MVTISPISPTPGRELLCQLTRGERRILLDAVHAASRR